MSDTINQFRDAIAASGLPQPDEVIDDGKIHRFSSNGKPRDESGWYVLHSDDLAAGAFGCWREGFTRSWCSKSATEMTQAERENHQNRVQAIKAQRDSEQAQRNELAAGEAKNRFNKASSCTSHPYLNAKGVQPHGVREEADGTLLVPMRDTTGKLWNVERINPADFKDKRGLSGGKRTGCFHSIGKIKDNRLVVCEGYATGASIFEATGDAVAIAFNAGNLEPVAQALRAKYAVLQIVLAADDDYQTEGNPGLTKARDAANAVAGYLAVPDFGDNRPENATDFNDLHQTSGFDSVVHCINVATVATVAVATPRNSWPELQPLFAHIAPQDYPLDALPDAVRCAVEEVAGFVKAPIPLIAASALAALSLAIQAHTDVERAEKLTGPCGLFLLAIADSGERKSTCDGFFTKAIRDYEAQEQEAAKPFVKAYKSDMEAWDSQRSGIKEAIKLASKTGKPSTDLIQQLHDLDDNTPTPPRVPRLIYGDATPEALTYALAKQWPSGGVISSEAGSVFGGHGMGSDSVMRNLAALNQLWDGAALPVERRSSESYIVRGARLTMALQVQEATIRAFFANTKGLARGTGFLARFLISWPQSTQGTRHFTEAPASWPALATFNNRLTAILNRPAPIDDGGTLDPAMLTLAPDAKAAWVAFHNAIESKLSAGRELYDVRDVASKTADNAARLAALFHTFTGSIGPIDIEAMESAARVTAWHLSEARRFLGELAMPAELANPARLESWMLDYCKRENTDKVPTRQIQQYGPCALRDQELYLKAVSELAELGRARLTKDGKKRAVHVNPALLTVAT